MKNTLLKKFDSLMSHLNSENNNMAQEFREHLIEAIMEGYEASTIVSALHEHGVDNWEGYVDAMFSVYRKQKE